MKTLTVTIIIAALPILASAYDDGYETYDSYNNEPSLVEKYFPNTQRHAPVYPTPMMPSLTRGNYGDRSAPPGGYNLITPHSLCHSDGYNTICYDR